MLLADFLRQRLELTGTHVGCDTVAMRRMRRAYGRQFGEVLHGAGGPGERREGDDDRGPVQGDQLHPVQAAFREAHGLQCGFCTPGMIMSAADLLAKHPKPTEAEIRELAVGQYLPLYWLSQHRQGRADGVRSDERHAIAAE